MSETKRMTFKEACEALGVSESELERLVAAGEIASIKDGDTLYFKREIIESYKTHRDTEPTVLLSDEEISLLDEGEEIDFGIELEPAGAPAAQSGEATERLDVRPAGQAEETVLNLDGILDEDAEGAVSAGVGDELLEDTSMGDETLLDTDVLDLGEDKDTFDLETAEDTMLDPVEEGTLLRGGGARVMQMKRKKSHAAWTAVLAVTALILLLPLSVMSSLVYTANTSGTAVEESAGEQSFTWVKKYNFLGGAIESVAGLFH